MDKEEFLSQLKGLISDIPEDDQKEAMEYYQDFFADAGPDKEQEIINDFVSPEYLADQIRETSAKRQRGEISRSADIGMVASMVNEEKAAQAAFGTGDSNIGGNRKMGAEGNSGTQGNPVQNPANMQNPNGPMGNPQMMQGQMRPGQMQNPQMMQQGRPMGNPQMMQGQMRPGQMQNPQMMQGQMPNPQMMQNRPMPNRMPGNGAGMVMNPNGAGGLMTKTIDGQGNQAQQISGLRKQQSQGITIDESELGGAENSDGKVVNPWEAKNQTKGEKTEEEKKAEERAKLKSETRDSAFLKSNRSQEGGGLFSDADNNIVTQEVDSGKKSLVMVLLIVTCPIWIAALAAMIAFVAVCAVGVLLSAGLALASLVGAVGSLVVGAIALINTKIGSLVFGLGLAIMLFGLTALFIMLCIFLFKSVPGLFYGVLSIIKGARVKAHMFTLKK